MSSNYDQDIPDSQRIEKQILSSWRPPLTTSYAVGILKGNELHLNTVHAVVQLRPSMEHLTAGRSKKTSAPQKVEDTSKKQVYAVCWSPRHQWYLLLFCLGCWSFERATTTLYWCLLDLPKSLRTNSICWLKMLKAMHLQPLF